MNWIIGQRRSSAARPVRIFAVFPVILVLLLGCTSASANVSDLERLALLDLFASTNGATWANSAGWGNGIGTECAWHGVTCAADGNSVEQLDLTGNNLSGALPASIQNLTGIKQLFLGNNAITGAMPILSGMQQLQDFGIGSNLLTGSIPPINGLANLSSFIAGNNDLIGSFPEISGLTALFQFDISDNHIVGGIPSLANLPTLASFNISDNEISGTIPSLAGLNNLQSFYVSGNQLSGAAPGAPDPNALVNNESRLCPNFLFSSTSPEWDAATGSSPWYLECTDDVIFRDGFDPGI